VSDLLFYGINFIQSLLTGDVIFIKLFLYFLFPGSSLQVDIASDNVKLLHDLLLHLEVESSDLLLVHFLGLDFTEPVQHRVVRLFIERVDHVGFDAIQLILHGLNKLIDVFFAVANFLVCLDPHVLHLDGKHVEVVPVHLCA
jgi:hypothetical protein